MSKFSDKLDRLHASRVRALEADEGGDDKRVFVAEIDDVSRSPASLPLFNPAEAAEARPAPAPSAARESMRAQLEARDRVASRGRQPKRVTMARATEQAVAVQPAATKPAPVSDNAVGERLAVLRTQAEALITVGGTEAALPLLHEMAALSPTHPFPLTHLAAYWRAQGNGRIAALYADRLAAIAPY